MSLNHPVFLHAPGRKAILWLTLSIVSTGFCAAYAGAQPAPPPPGAPTRTLPFSVGVLERSRTDAVSFFNDAPYTTTYPYVEQLLRVSLAQKIRHFDYQIEVSENNVFDVPTTSVDPVSARGQLFLGGTYYAANANTLPVAASFRQGFLRYRGKGPDTSLRIGRFEFFEGQETAPKNPTLLWLQPNRATSDRQLRLLQRAAQF
jgi:hypothetical protein